MSKKILVTLPLSDEQKQRFIRVANNQDVQFTEVAKLTEVDVSQANIIMGQVPARFIKKSEKLELIQLASAGVDAYCKEGVLHEHTILTNATGAYNKSVAEHALATIFMLQKNLHLYYADNVSGVWRDHGKVTSISESTIAIIGLGDIGKYLAKQVKLLGAKVIGIKRHMGEIPDFVDELHTLENINDIASRADVIVNILPGTKETEKIYNAKFFSHMKETGIFINVGRGSAVVEDDLLQAVHEKQFFAAGLDTTVEEPLPIESPLWKEENILITPHIAGGFHMDSIFEEIIKIAVYNLENYLLDNKLMNVVDRTKGY